MVGLGKGLRGVDLWCWRVPWDAVEVKLNCRAPASWPAQVVGAGRPGILQFGMASPMPWPGARGGGKMKILWALLPAVGGRTHSLLWLEEFQRLWLRDDRSKRSGPKGLLLWRQLQTAGRRRAACLPSQKERRRPQQILRSWQAVRWCCRVGCHRPGEAIGVGKGVRTLHGWSQPEKIAEVIVGEWEELVG